MNFIKDFLIPIVTLFVAIYIPKKIAWEATYNSLISEYRTIEFGKAFQEIIEFFVNDCHNNVDFIKINYEKKYKQNHEIHYQRRMLSQFFVELDKCASTKPWYIGEKRVQRDFTTGTRDMIKIIYFMGKAVDESDILMQDISCDDRVPNSSHVKGQNQKIAHLYEKLKGTKKYMR